MTSDAKDWSEWDDWKWHKWSGRDGVMTGVTWRMGFVGTRFSVFFRAMKKTWLVGLYKG